jgi:F-type H+-transporting ATPase subunit b
LEKKGICMDILKNFGIDPVLIVAQIVNFLIVLFILKRFLYKPVMDLLKKRQESIEQGLKQAEKTKALMDEAVEKEKEILKKAQAEAAALLDDARSQREKFLQDAKDAAKLKEQRILDEAKKQISYEINQAHKELSQNVSSLAVGLLRKSANDLFDKEDQELVVKNALKRIKNHE